MKTKFYVGLGAIAVLITAAMLGSQLETNAIAQETLEQPVVDQPQTNDLQTGETQEYDRDKQGSACKASELLGMNVRGRNSEDEIGEIKDLMIGHDGRVIYAAVSFGGFLGIGDKMFAVPLEAIEFVRNDDDAYARMDVSEETLKNIEGFNQDNWPVQANRNFRSDTSRHAERPSTDVGVE